MKKKLKTARQLGLTKDQYCGLIKALVFLESGQLKGIRHSTYSNRAWTAGEPSIKGARFNMASWVQRYEGCGTICCIGGTAELLMGAEPATLYERNESIELDELFYPREGGFHWVTPPQGPWTATPKQAAKALRSYLMSGKADWEAAMRKD